MPNPTDEELHKYSLLGRPEQRHGSRSLADTVILMDSISNMRSLCARRLAESGVHVDYAMRSLAILRERTDLNSSLAKACATLVLWKRTCGTECGVAQVEQFLWKLRNS